MLYTYSPIDSYLIGSRRKEKHTLNHTYLICFRIHYDYFPPRAHFFLLLHLFTFAFTSFGARQAKPKVYFYALIDKSATSKRVPF